MATHTRLRALHLENRHRRIRARVHGTQVRPRLSVFRSKSHLLLQLINDEQGKTILSVHDREAKKEDAPKDLSKGIARAYGAGMLLAERAKANKIKHVVFDRGGYAYHGRVKAAADGARAGGLDF